MTRLPPEQSAVISLRAFHGLSVPQIAEKLGRSSDSIYKVWSRAIQSLEKDLRSYEQVAQ